MNLKRIRLPLKNVINRALPGVVCFMFPLMAYSQELSRCDSIRKSDSLFVHGYGLYNAQKYSQALPFFEKLLAIDSLLYKTEHRQRIIYAGMWLGNTLYKLGKEDLALKDHYTSLYYKASPVDPRQMSEVDSLASLAQELERAQSIKKDTFSNDEIMTWLDEYAQRYKSGIIGENEIVSLYKKRGELLGRLLPRHHIWAANNDMLLAFHLTSELIFYSSVSNPYEKDPRINEWYRVRHERDSLYLNYVESVKLLYGERSMKYINTLISSYYPLCNNQVNTSDVGRTLLRDSYNLCMDVFPSDTTSLIKSASFLGEACRLRAEDEYKKTLKLSNSECADILMTSINYYMDADSAYNYVLQYANSWQDEVWAYKKKAGCFFSLANISSRLKNCSFNERDNRFYYNSDSVETSSQTRYIEQVNRYNFIDYITQILRQGVDRTQEFKLIKVGLNNVQNAINSYCDPDDPTFSYEEYSQLWNTLAHKQSEAHLYPESAESHQHLSQIALSFDDYDTYFNSIDEALTQYHFIYESSHDLGVLKQTISACEEFLEALSDSSINASIKNRDHIYRLRTHVIDKIGSAYFDIGEATHDKQAYLKALPHVKEYLDSCVQNRRWGNPTYRLAKYAECLWQIGETEEAIRLAQQQQDTTFRDCANMFLFSQRKVREQIVDYDISQFDLYVKRAFQRREQIGAGILAYNKELFTKGLLVNSERLLMDFVYMHSDDDLLHELFDQWELVKNEANSEDAYDTYKADSLESMLLIRCKELGNYNEAVLVDWTQVKKNLRAKDIAIEFAKFPIESGIQYVAITLTKKDSEPQIVPLFMESDIQKIPTRDYYRQDDITRLVWGPIYDKLKGAKNVYFAPAGVLYNINIESLPQIGKSSLMSDRWNMYRLSSTKELVWKKDKISVSRAAVYGGLQYDTDTATLIKNQKDYSPAKRQSGFILQDALTKYIAHRGAIETIAYLPATKKEAEAINRELASSQIDNQLYVDEYGTEESFKNLSGKDINILHIATHGFYWTPQEATQMGDLSFLSLTSRYSEDKSLIRSGLLFAGANNAWSGISVPEGLDDGILTAMEVSSLDLRKVDLIVLSACQTAQGEIMSDGVFGLQRGFKKAGAQSILMSLWKVDDEATCMLMTEFYKNWIGEKMTKHDALEAAKQTVRSHKDKGWDDPKYWAAFILLDALD